MNVDEMMEPDFEDFIMIQDGLFSAAECREMIESFEAMSAAGFTSNGGVGYGHDGGFELGRRKDEVAYSTHLCAPQNKSTGITELKGMQTAHLDIMQRIGACWNMYAARYGVSDQVRLQDAKWQKTEPGGGFHIWHYERGPNEYASRIAVWMVYLNDVEDGGETEFLHQQKRYNPKAGTLVLWPAGYTHIHRGNPPLKEDKYILTGWVEY